MSINIKTTGMSGEVYLTPYKVYVALLTQINNNPPQAIVLNANDSNYLGNIVWSYDSVGNYIGTLVGAFTDEKTYVLISNTSGDPNVFFSAGVSGAPDTVFVISAAGGIADDYHLVYTPIEIRVYPA